MWEDSETDPSLCPSLYLFNIFKYNTNTLFVFDKVKFSLKRKKGGHNPIQIIWE